MGQDGFSWFIGVVEDRADPKKAGRVRVRCLGHHSEDVNDIPTAELPWASPMMPITAGGNSGIGVSSHFLIEGTWVVGFFRDPAKQEPVIMGALPGVNTKETTNQTIASSSEEGGKSTKGGFRDPRYSSNPNTTYAYKKVPTWDRDNRGETGTFPRELYLDKPDTNVLAAEDSGVHDCNNLDMQGDYPEGFTRPKMTRKSWNTATGTYMMEAVSGMRDAKYPYNHVLESESGHFVEFDDTEGNERIHVYHRKGTFIEIDKDSNVVIKTTGNVTNIVAKNMDTYVEGNYTLSVKGNIEVYAIGDLTEKVKGDRKTTIMGTETLEITGDITETFKANITTNITGNLTTDITGLGSIKSKAAMVVGGSSISFN